MPIYEIEEYFEVDLPEEKDYETLGGFLMSQSGTVPEAGEEVLWKNLLFRVLEADEKKVISVEIAKIERLDEDSEPLEQLVG